MGEEWRIEKWSDFGVLIFNDGERRTGHTTDGRRNCIAYLSALCPLIQHAAETILVVVLVMCEPTRSKALNTTP